MCSFLQVIICSIFLLPLRAFVGDFSDWESKAENTNGFIQSLAAAVKAFNTGKVGLQHVKLTACSPESFRSGSTMETGFEVIVFPDGVAYKNMKTEHIPAFIEQQLGQSQVSYLVPHASVSSLYCVVCSSCLFFAILPVIIFVRLLVFAAQIVPDIPRVEQAVGGSEVFVCCHMKKDERCGRRGPIIAAALVTGSLSLSLSLFDLYDAC